MPVFQLFLTHSHHNFLPFWRRENETASTATVLKTINLHKCTQLFVSRNLILNGTDVCAQANLNCIHKVWKKLGPHPANWEHALQQEIQGTQPHVCKQQHILITLLMQSIIHQTTKPLTSLHTPLSTSNNHMSLSALPLNPPPTSSSGCSCPGRGPAIQQAAWESLAGGLGPPVVFSLVQCWGKSRPTTCTQCTAAPCNWWSY